MLVPGDGSTLACEPAFRRGVLAYPITIRITLSESGGADVRLWSMLRGRDAGTPDCCTGEISATCLMGVFC
jgi:hypothetical protein